MKDWVVCSGIVALTIVGLLLILTRTDSGLVTGVISGISGLVGVKLGSQIHK